MEYFLQGLLNVKPQFIYLQTSAFNEINDWAISIESL